MSKAVEAMRWISAEPGMENLRLERFDPPQPGDGGLLVEVRCAALNFSDLLMIDDKYQVRPPRPFTPGQEIAGVVVETGANSVFRAGDRVAGKIEWGGFATHALMRADMAIRLPALCSFAEGAALPVSYTTAHVALTECTRIKAGETVLVHAGAGGVGLAAVQVAAARGARVIATASSAEKRALAEANGAAHTLDYTQTDWLAACKEVTNGRGVDVIVDPVGGAVTIDSLRVLAAGGRILIVGFASGEIASIPANRLLLKRAAAIGVYWNHDTDAEMLRRVTDAITTDLDRGAIKPLVDRRDGLTSLPKALADLSMRRTAGKVVLDLNTQTSDG